MPETNSIQIIAPVQTPKCVNRQEVMAYLPIANVTGQSTTHAASQKLVTDLYDASEEKFENYYTKSETNALLLTKLDKVTSTYTHNRAYVVTPSGFQNVIKVTPSEEANTIAYRNESGQIAVGIPTQSMHATTKVYVDDNIQVAKNYAKNYTDTEIQKIKDEPDVVDIVNTYAQLLEKYPETSETTLGDKDIVRVLVDEMHEGQSSYYKWHKISPQYKWEYIGSVGNYYTKTQIDNKFTNYYDKTQIDTTFTNYYDKTQIDTTFTNYYDKSQTSLLLSSKVDKITGKGLSSNDFTDDDKYKLDILSVPDATSLSFSKLNWRYSGSFYYIYFNNALTKKNDDNYLVQLLEKSSQTINGQIVYGAKTIHDNIFKAEDGGLYITSNERFDGKLYIRDIEHSITFEDTDWQETENGYEIVYTSSDTGLENEKYIVQLDKSNEVIISGETVSGLSTTSDALIKDMSGGIHIIANKTFEGRLSFVEKDVEQSFTSSNWLLVGNEYQYFIPSQTTEYSTDEFIVQIDKLQDENYYTVNDVSFKTESGGLLLTSSIAFAGKVTLINAEKHSKDSVTSVNGKIGDVVLDATNIKLTTNLQSVQDNFIRIDETLDLKLDATKQAIATIGGLVVPTAAPIETILTGITSDREQVQIKIGTGLSLEGDTSPFTLTTGGGISDVQNADGTSFVSNNIATIPDATETVKGLATLPKDYELVEKVIIGYSILTTQPEDWETNYTSYYKTNGKEPNALDFNYVALTELETWESGKYYSYSSDGAYLFRYNEPNGTPYNFKSIVITGTIAAASSSLLVYWYFRNNQGENIWTYTSGPNIKTSNNYFYLKIDLLNDTLMQVTNFDNTNRLGTSSTASSSSYINTDCKNWKGGFASRQNPLTSGSTIYIYGLRR